MKESKLILMTNPNVSNPPVAHADSYRQDKMQPLTSRERSARRAFRWPRRLFEQPACSTPHGRSKRTKVWRKVTSCTGSKATNTSLNVIIHLTSLVKEPLMSKDKPTITHADDWGHDRDRANAKRASRLLLERLEAVHPEGGERRCATDGSIKSIWSLLSLPIR